MSATASSALVMLCCCSKNGIWMSLTIDVVLIFSRSRNVFLIFIVYTYLERIISGQGRLCVVASGVIQTQKAGKVDEFRKLRSQ